MGKTPEYVREAIRKYETKFDKKTINFPKGTTERVKQLTGQTFSAYVIDLVLTDLDRLEDKTTNSAPITEKQLIRSNTEPHRQKNRPKKGEPIQIPSGFDNWPDEEKSAYMLEKTKAQYTPEEWEQLQREEKARRDKMLQDYQKHLDWISRNQDQQKQISKDQNGENCPF